MDMNMFAALGKPDACLHHCLTCGAYTSEFEDNINNGVCDNCPRLTDIAPEFWRVIMKRAGMGDMDARKTIERYG